jgi:uncharacterized LabA/DUF88 family protein
VSVDRTAIFIDAGYFEKIIEKDFSRTPVDYAKLAAELTNGKELLRAYYYNCPPYQGNPPTPDETGRKARSDRFYASLNQISRFEVRLGRLEKRQCGSCRTPSFRQKRVDIMLAVDMVSISTKQQISRAVLVAGDSDLLPAVLASKEAGVLVHLYHGGPGNPAHRDLYAACDDRSLIDRALVEKVKRVR